MRVGTKSVLFGAHCMLIHPVVLFVAYWKLYGFPRDLRLWLSFLIHDLGYFGCVNMDGEGGEKHVELGGQIVDFLTGKEWGDFTRRHSRAWCARHGETPSRLCVADKLAFVLTPAWLYLPMAKATGELREYMAVADGRTGSADYSEDERRLLNSEDPRLWLEGLKHYTRRWVEKHHDRPTVGEISDELLKKLTMRGMPR